MLQQFFGILNASLSTHPRLFVAYLSLPIRPMMGVGTSRNHRARWWLTVGVVSVTVEAGDGLHWSS